MKNPQSEAIGGQMEITPRVTPSGASVDFPSKQMIDTAKPQAVDTLSSLFGSKGIIHGLGSTVVGVIAGPQAGKAADNIFGSLEDAGLNKLKQG